MNYRTPVSIAEKPFPVNPSFGNGKPDTPKLFMSLVQNSPLPSRNLPAAPHYVSNRRVIPSFLANPLCKIKCWGVDVFRLVLEIMNLKEIDDNILDIFIPKDIPFLPSHVQDVHQMRYNKRV
jgi:hypothetical protein